MSHQQPGTKAFRDTVPSVAYRTLRDLSYEVNVAFQNCMLDDLVPIEDGLKIVCIYSNKMASQSHACPVLVEVGTQ